MHREDHRRGGTGAAERVAHVGEVENRGAFATKILWNLDTQQALDARRVNGFLRETRFAIDVFGVFSRGYRDRGGALWKGTAIRDDVFTGVGSRKIVNVHCHYALDELSVRAVACFAKGRIGHSNKFRFTPRLKDLIQMRR